MTQIENFYFDIDKKHNRKDILNLFNKEKEKTECLKIECLYTFDSLILNDDNFLDKYEISLDLCPMMKYQIDNSWLECFEDWIIDNDLDLAYCDIDYDSCIEKIENLINSKKYDPLKEQWIKLNFICNYEESKNTFIDITVAHLLKDLTIYITEKKEEIKQ